MPGRDDLDVHVGEQVVRLAGQRPIDVCIEGRAVETLKGGRNADGWDGGPAQ